MKKIYVKQDRKDTSNIFLKPTKFKCSTSDKNCTSDTKFQEKVVFLTYSQLFKLISRCLLTASLQILILHFRITPNPQTVWTDWCITLPEFCRKKSKINDEQIKHFTRCDYRNHVEKVGKENILGKFNSKFRLNPIIDPTKSR